MKHLKLFEEVAAKVAPPAATTSTPPVGKALPKTSGASTPPTTSKPLTDRDILGETSFFANYFAVADFERKIAQMFSKVLDEKSRKSLIGMLKDKRTGVKGAVDALDGWVTEQNLAYLKSILVSLEGKQMADGKSALKRFMELYAIDENGDSLYDDVASVGTKTFSVEGALIKQDILKMLYKASKGK